MGWSKINACFYDSSVRAYQFNVIFPLWKNEFIIKDTKQNKKRKLDIEASNQYFCITVYQLMLSKKWRLLIYLLCWLRLWFLAFSYWNCFDVYQGFAYSGGLGILLTKNFHNFKTKVFLFLQNGRTFSGWLHGSSKTNSWNSVLTILNSDLLEICNILKTRTIILNLPLFVNWLNYKMFVNLLN